MSATQDLDQIIESIRPLVAAGASVHWLNRRQKSPRDADWQNAPVRTIEQLRATWSRGLNVGLRPGEWSKTEHGYLHLVDMDIRDADQAEDAWDWLLERWPEARDAPFVVSGSGGESRHLYFFTDRPFRSRKIAQSEGFREVFDEKLGRNVKKRDWEIEVYGTRKQVVLPPSVHPDTGEPYRWGREIDWTLLSIGVGPIVPSEQVEEWGVEEDDLDLGDDDDLLRQVKLEPMGLSEAEISSILAEIPNDDADYDEFITVGMALAHEYEGKRAGFDRWCEWAKQSSKFDLKTCAMKWRSFKGMTRSPVRMASLIKVAGDARMAREHAELGLIDDILSVDGADNRSLIITDTQTSDIDALLDVTPGPARRTTAEPTFDPNWREYLQRNEDGALKPTLHNFDLVVCNDPRLRGVIGWNEFSQEIVLRRPPGRMTLSKKSPKPVRQLEGPLWHVKDRVNGDLWTDSHDINLSLLFETPLRQGGYDLKTSDRYVRGAVNRAAQSNRFHPVRDYLEGLEWDGVRRVDRLFVDYLGATNTPYHRQAATLFLVGAVTRVFEPGHKFDFVPILEGLQGKRKSSFVRALGKDWFAELEGDFHDTKSMVERTQGAWIVEIPELQGFSKAEVTTIKGFISRPVDKVRLAYEKRAMNFPRQWVAIGSTNEAEYLRDMTGGRRFWPIACEVEEIDIDRLKENLDQIWAEARAMYLAWRREQPTSELPLYLKDPGAAAEAKLLQESRRQETVEEATAARIAHWLDTPINADLGFDKEFDETPVYRNQFCLLEIWKHMMGREMKDYDSRAQQMLGRAVRLLPGWSMSGRKRVDEYGLQRVFTRVVPR